jgi:hypothetical protein
VTLDSDGFTTFKIKIDLTTIIYDICNLSKIQILLIAKSLKSLSLDFFNSLSIYLHRLIFGFQATHCIFGTDNTTKMIISGPI